MTTRSCYRNNILTDMASILIVEDDLTYATMMQTWLRKKGFTVEKTSSVSAAAQASTSYCLTSVCPTTTVCFCSTGCARRTCRRPSS